MSHSVSHLRAGVIGTGFIAPVHIEALKRLGVTDVLAVSSVGSLVEERPPGSFTIVDQFIDRTKGRVSSFFGTGCVAHVSMADPVCPRLSALVADAAGEGVDRGGTYLAMEGPQFSTRAESLLYRQWGCHVIGMTAMPEAKLAREAELPYALVGMVTDYDCWREDEAAVDVTQVLAQLSANAAKARSMVLASSSERSSCLKLAVPARTPTPWALATPAVTSSIPPTTIERSTLTVASLSRTAYATHCSGKLRARGVDERQFLMRPRDEGPLGRHRDGAHVLGEIVRIRHDEPPGEGAKALVMTL